MDTFTAAIAISMKRHLVIAGTGRAGTTFLVQYLTACGLETHLTRHPDEKLDASANAGLEDLPDENSDLPYVIKSPWLYEFIDRLLARTDTAIDAVIIPMRDIVDAASSRITLELQARLGHEAIAEEYTRWETWGTTPGGVVYSLNALDQARLLAIGFHHVVHALVKKNIPIVFLDFPTLVEDGAYLYDRLAPVVGKYISRNDALGVHASLARPDMVRAGKEFAAPNEVTKTSIRYPDHLTLDRAALFRALKQSRSETLEARDYLRTAETMLAASEERAAHAEQRTIELEQRLSPAESELDATRHRLAEAEHMLAVAKQAQTVAEQQANTMAEELWVEKSAKANFELSVLDLRASRAVQVSDLAIAQEESLSLRSALEEEIAKREPLEEKHARLLSENTHLQQEVDELRRQLTEIQQQLSSVLSSTTWRATSGIRHIITALRHRT